MPVKYELSNDTWTSDEIQAAEHVINSGMFTMGKNVEDFEKMFADHFGAKYAVMSNSGSSANLLAIASLVYSGILKKGDEVLVPAVSWSTTYFPLEQCGLKMRLVDIDLGTLNMNPDLIESAITDRTRAIFAVNLLGNPNDFDIINKICFKHNLVLIEDNCESMDAEYHGKKTGTFGVVGTFSTFYSHHICTMEGGVTITDDERLYQYMRSIRSHGWTRSMPVDSPYYKKSDDDFYDSFCFIMPGYNVRPLEIEGAVGIEQLKKLDNFIRVRRENASLFQKEIKKDGRFLIQKETGTSSWFGFALILNRENAGRRDEFINAIRKAGIAVRPIVAGNFARQPAFRFMDATVSGKLESADYIHDNGFFVGNHSINLKEQIHYLIETLHGVA